MDKNIFQRQALVKQSFFQRLFRQQPEENAIIEVNNLLASKPIRQITKAEIIQIGLFHNIRIEHAFTLNLEEFYAVYLNHCLADKRLDDSEMQDLDHLKFLFSLNDSTLTYLHSQIGLTVYKASIEEVIVDGRLSAEEKTFLARMQNELKLPQELADKIFEESRGQFLSGHIDNLISSATFSPSDEKDLQAIAKSLGVDVNPVSQTRQLMQLKSYWALENLPLNLLQPDIPLQKAEQCYFIAAHVSWYERRGAATYNKRLHTLDPKSFYLQETSKQKSYDNNLLRYVDKGKLYLSNKRIIFVGNTKNATIRIDRIMSIMPYRKAVHILKETGRSPILHFPEDEDMFSLTLERLLKSFS